jgi:hypothetical protein
MMKFRENTNSQSGGPDGAGKQGPKLLGHSEKQGPPLVGSAARRTQQRWALLGSKTQYHGVWLNKLRSGWGARPGQLGFGCATCPSSNF